MYKNIMKLLVLTVGLSLLGGCASVGHLAHLYSDSALKPHIHRYKDGGEAIYYRFDVGKAPYETYLFFYAATGCGSLKAYLPAYVEGLGVSAKVFALNKRFVGDKSTGMFGCSEAFHKNNSLDRWISDYTDFVTTQLKKAKRPPKNVVLVGVSEAGFATVRTALNIPEVTHVALIGNGGYTMRRSLKTLYEKGSIVFDVEKGAKKIAANPNSIDDTWYGNTYRWWSKILDYDPLPYLLRLKVPVLLGMGENDKSHAVESGYYLKSAFQKAGKTNLMLKVYPKADHRLQDGDTNYRKVFFKTLGKMLKGAT